MEDDHVTITLPLSAHGLGVIFFVVGVLVMSGVVYALLPRDRPASDWLTRLQKRAGLEGWHPLLVITLSVTWALVALTLFGGLYTAIWEMIFQKPPEGQEAVWNWRFSIAQVVALTTVLGAVIALPITINRLVLTRRQTNTIEQGHITDRINTAVQGLGAEKTVKHGGDHETTQPNLEVRIGAIYALERIAQDSDRDHVQIMEILCAYIRQNAPAPAEDDWPELDMKEGENEGPLEADWEERLKTFEQDQKKAKANLKTPREDIQTALTVIGRRSAKQRRLEAGRGIDVTFPFDTPFPNYNVPDDSHDKGTLDAYIEKLKAWKGALEAYNGYRLDLRNADLRGADLSEADLKGARLTGTYLHGANLLDACMQGASIRAARLQGADLVGVRLQGADLVAARLQGANLWLAELQGADFSHARLQNAHLSQACLQGADLSQAGVQGSDLSQARLQGADFGNALLQETDLTAVRLQGTFLWLAQLQGADLSQARLDEHTDLSAANPKGAAVRDVDLSNIPQIEAHVQGMFGDRSVTLPGGHGPEHEDWPKHWPKFKMDLFYFHDEWQKWQTAFLGDRPPKPPEPEKTG